MHQQGPQHDPSSHTVAVRHNQTGFTNSAFDQKGKVAEDGGYEEEGSGGSEFDAEIGDRGE